MNNIVNEAVIATLQAGVLVEARAPVGGLRYFRCLTCEKENIFNLPAHIQQLGHRNSLAWDVIKQDHPSPALLRLLPEDVRLAKQSGHVESVSKTLSSFRCRVCQGKKPFSGVMPLLQHVTGKEHKKALERAKYATQAPYSPPVVPPAPLSAASLADSQPSNAYQLWQNPRPVPEPSPSPPAPLVRRDLANDTLDILKAEVEENLRRGVLVVAEKTATHTSYYCRSCATPLTGDEPLRQHIRGKKHEKKTKQKESHSEGADRFVAQVDSLVVDPSTMRSSVPLPPSVAITTIRPFPWNVRPALRPRMPDAGVYKNLSMPRGIVNIFNYYFSDTQQVRLGATVDTFNLRELFGKMGYHVKVHEELSREATVERLHAIQSNVELHCYDSFIMIFLSHGKDDTVFYTKDQEVMSLDDVRYFFVDGKCPRLKNKPKLFFANFCRGKIEETRKFETDYSGSDKTAEAPQDMTTIYASIKNFMAVRDSENGTIFVQALCQVLAEHAHELELHELYYELCSAMKKKEGTTPEYQNYSFKKFFFNPIAMEGPLRE
ncbi:cell death protein 3-like isoform X2 [Penaeus japonicus]|uniref:cell death protein 3-like isoform X2 n=1 Tax=Penaeus japonicus TaxID=27405 RepID=UPI001C71672A|nr:cell death protein 3-like isoform X2 [Penaeus japonicus]